MSYGFLSYVSDSLGHCTEYNTYGNQTKTAHNAHYIRLRKPFFLLKVSKIV